MRLLTLPFFTLLSLLGVAGSLKCYDCEGRVCVADTCEGDYCVVTAFTPMWASTEFRPRKIIKGCVKGSLLKKDIPTACETVPDKEEFITNCFCSSGDFCNQNLQVHPKKDLKLVKCACDAQECHGPRSGTCIGEYCTILKDKKAKEEIRGCVNSTTSLIERRGDGAIIQPPLTGGVHQAGQDMKNVLETESYMCSKDWCNNEWPKNLQPRTLHCPTFYAVDLQGFHKEDKKGEECLGEYCWNVTITADGDGLYRGYRAGGCMTLLQGSEISSEFNAAGCLEFESEKFTIHACFHSDGRPVLKEAEKIIKVEENLVKEEEKELAKDEKIVHKEEPILAEEEAESNSTLIAVFVCIMISIVLVGVVWKFQIHRRLFRARYETVAG